jgi:putative spermidine/putrescine transport system ATP-binding protein
MEQLVGVSAHGSLRPEAIRLGDGPLTGTVRDAAFLGSATRVELDVDGHMISLLVPKGGAVPETGTTASITWDTSALHVMGKNG